MVMMVRWMQSQKSGWQIRTGFPHRRCPGVRNFSFVRRHCGNLAINCQEEAKTGGHRAFDCPGAEAPDNGRS